MTISLENTNAMPEAEGASAPAGNKQWRADASPQGPAPAAPLPGTGDHSDYNSSEADDNPYYDALAAFLFWKSYLPEDAIAALHRSYDRELKESAPAPGPGPLQQFEVSSGKSILDKVIRKGHAPAFAAAVEVLLKDDAEADARFDVAAIQFVDSSALAAEFKAGQWLDELRATAKRINVLKDGYLLNISPEQEKRENWVTVEPTPDIKIRYRLEDRPNPAAAKGVKKGTSADVAPAKSQVLHTISDIVLRASDPEKAKKQHPGLDFFHLVILMKEIDLQTTWLPTMLGYGTEKSCTIDRPLPNQNFGFWGLALPFIAKRDILGRLDVFHLLPKNEGANANTKSAGAAMNKMNPPSPTARRDNVASKATREQLFQQAVLVGSVSVNDLSDPVQAVSLFPELLSEFNGGVSAEVVAGDNLKGGFGPTRGIFEDAKKRALDSQNESSVAQLDHGHEKERLARLRVPKEKYKLQYIPPAFAGGQTKQEYAPSARRSSTSGRPSRNFGDTGDNDEEGRFPVQQVAPRRPKLKPQPTILTSGNFEDWVHMGHSAKASSMVLEQMRARLHQKKVRQSPSGWQREDVSSSSSSSLGAAAARPSTPFPNPKTKNAAALPKRQPSRLAEDLREAYAMLGGVGTFGTRDFGNLDLQEGEHRSSASSPGVESSCVTETESEAADVEENDEDDFATARGNLHARLAISCSGSGDDDHTSAQRKICSSEDSIFLKWQEQCGQSEDVAVELDAVPFFGFGSGKDLVQVRLEMPDVDSCGQILEDEEVDVLASSGEDDVEHRATQRISEGSHMANRIEDLDEYLEGDSDVISSSALFQKAATNTSKKPRPSGGKGGPKRMSTLHEFLNFDEEEEEGRAEVVPATVDVKGQEEPKASVSVSPHPQPRSSQAIQKATTQYEEIHMYYDETEKERDHVRCEVDTSRTAINGAVVTPHYPEPGDVHMRVMLSLDPKLETIPEVLLDYGLHKSPEMLLQIMQSEEVKSELLRSVAYKDRYCDVDDLYYVRLRKDIEDHFPSQYKLPPVQQRKVVAGVNAKLGLRVRRGIDWLKGRKVWSCIDGNKVKEPSSSSPLAGAVDMPFQFVPIAAKNDSNIPTYRLLSDAELEAADSPKTDGSNLPDAAFGEFYTGTIVSVNVKEKTCRVEYKYTNVWGATYCEVFDGYRIGKNGKYDLGVWFPGEDKTDEDDRMAS
eukprot:g5272.t1